MRYHSNLLLLLQSIIAATFLNAVVSAHAQTYSLEALQGGWWRDCNDPAVEFHIDGDQYSGDFEGSYKITLKGDILTFNHGLIDGHSVHVTEKPQSFQILNVTKEELILRPVSDNQGDWLLKSCKESR